MATKKTPVTEDDALLPSAEEGGLDQAIDDLRGVLQADTDGDVPGFGADFGTVDGDLTAFETPAVSDNFASSDFSGGDFVGTEAENTGFSGADFGGADLGGNDFGDNAFSGSTQEPGSALTANLDLIMDIPIDVEIVLGSSRMQVSGLMNLEEGATIALDRKIGEPVEIMVNGRRIGKGEITVLENDDTRFGVKVTEVLGTRTA